MRCREIRRYVVLIVSAASVLMAVRTAGAQQPNATGACSLLSREEVGQALGAPVGEGRALVSTGVVTSCSFPAKGGGSVPILLRRNAGRAWIAEQEYRMNKGVGHGAFRPVAGLGERAFVLDMRWAGAALCVFRGEHYLQVSAFGIGDADAHAAAEKLAGMAMSRLESPPNLNQVARGGRFFYSYRAHLKQ